MRSKNIINSSKYLVNALTFIVNMQIVSAQ